MSKALRVNRSQIRGVTQRQMRAQEMPQEIPILRGVRTSRFWSAASSYLKQVGSYDDNFRSCSIVNEPLEMLELAPLPPPLSPLEDLPPLPALLSSYDEVPSVEQRPLRIVERQEPLPVRQALPPPDSTVYDSKQDMDDLLSLLSNANIEVSEVKALPSGTFRITLDDLMKESRSPEFVMAGGGR